MLRRSGHRSTFMASPDFLPAPSKRIAECPLSAYRDRPYVARAAAGRPGTAPVFCLIGQCGRTPAPADRGRAYSSRLPTYFSRYMLHFVNLSAQNRLQLVHHRFARNYLAEWAGGSMDKPFYRSDHCTDHCSKRCPRRRFLGSSLVVLAGTLLDALTTPLWKWKQ